MVAQNVASSLTDILNDIVVDGGSPRPYYLFEGKLDVISSSSEIPPCDFLGGNGKIAVRRIGERLYEFTLYSGELPSPYNGTSHKISLYTRAEWRIALPDGVTVQLEGPLMARFSGEYKGVLHL